MKRSLLRVQLKQMIPGKQSLLWFLAVAALVLCVALVKYPKQEVNYRNSNATWHTLYTVECYRETPARVHKFLPLVSLGKPTDKWIPWGATLNDDQGNQYYTSFSAAGFFLPWLFFRVFHLSVCERSLFIFNTVLLCASCLFMGWLILYLYRECRLRWLLALLAVFACITAPEVLHGMGVTYWHQSVLQAALPLQIYAFVRRRDSAGYEFLFLLLCLANPLIEWTGYVANAGFAAAELFSKDKLWNKLKKSALIGLITLASFDLFCLHFMSTVDASSFFRLLKDRFTARNYATSVPLSELFGQGGIYWLLWVAVWADSGSAAGRIHPLPGICLEKG